MVREYAEFSLRVVRLAGIPERIKLLNDKWWPAALGRA